MACCGQTVTNPLKWPLPINEALGMAGGLQVLWSMAAVGLTVHFGYWVCTLVAGTSLSHYHLCSTMHSEEKNSTGLGITMTPVCLKVGELCSFHRVQKQKVRQRGIASAGQRGTE